MALVSRAPQPNAARPDWVTLVAATHADIPLARLVAAALERRSVCRTRVLARAELRGQACDALVSAASAESLGTVLFAMRRASTREAAAHSHSTRRPLVLVHPRPVTAHYALALRSGIDEIIAWPQEFHQWSIGASSHASEPEEPARGGPNGPEFELPGSSEAMRRLRERVARIAAFDTNVFLVGESGSGKERVARALHRLSRRRAEPLVILNCSALPENLIEADLFGYERGAFTNAHAAYPGKFALADRGTLFLDEIGDMPRAVQAKILRVIEGHEYFRIGASRPTRSDVRLIAATHRDVEQLCEQGEFRHDLYFRLNVARIELPNLRDRVCDIAPLAERFVNEFRHEMPRPHVALSPEVRTALRAYAWPGNVRELRNAVESAMIQCEGEAIEVRDLPAHVVRWLERAVAPPDERTMLVSTLQHTHWNKSETARTLNWSRMKLYRKLRQYSLDTRTSHD